ncbi:6817_t:CDS:2, partial [Racocetra persica]
RLLLVSLLENFCLLYDTNPDGSRKLFYVICKMLSAMGIIEEEYIDEMSTVRSSYQCAFKALVVQALNSIKQEQIMMESHMIMPPTSVSGIPENGKSSPVNHDEI